MFKKQTTGNANLSNIIVLVSALSTPVEMKLKLIPIFRHMHYDLQLTAKVSHSTFKGIVNKQLLDEVERDIMNFQNRGLCYLLKPKAEADNTDTRFC